MSDLVQRLKAIHECYPEPRLHAEAAERIRELEVERDAATRALTEMRAAAENVLQHFMPSFPDGRFVDDCLVELALALAERSEVASPMISI